MDRSTKQKIKKETQTLNDTIGQLDLIDIYRNGEVAQGNMVTAGVALITPGENSSGTWEAGRGAMFVPS